MSKRALPTVHYAEEESDDETCITIKRKRKRQKLSKVKRMNSSETRNGENSDDEFVPQKCNGNAVGKYSSGRRQRRDSNYHGSRSKIKSRLRRRKKISHRRSLRSLGLEEEGTSCDDEDDDDIGALATSQRRRSSSRDSFPNMLLRRSNRTKKTRFKTLNISTIEDEVLEEEPENEPPNTRKTPVRDKLVKSEVRDLLIAQGKSPDDLESLQPPDIYSGIKSRQRQPKKFFNDEYADLSGQEVFDHHQSTPTTEQEINKDPLDVPEAENLNQRNECENENNETVENHTEEKLKTEPMEEENEGDSNSDENNDDEEENDEDEDDSDEDDSDVVQHVTRRKYSLRKKRAQPSRLVDELKRQARRGSDGLFDTISSRVASHRRHKTKKNFQQNTASPYQQREERRTYSQGGSTTSVSSGADDDDERKFERRKEKSMTKARNRCLPMNLTISDLGTHGFSNERKKIGSSLADVDPMHIDRTVRFDSIGGHRKHVRSLKEMVVFPLMYPEVFHKFSINPPRGCLFYGPPGTGKTLMARALANECSLEGKKVAFFMRKGADCLSKWVGESERQLRLLFDQAYQMRPSIIFFDEIDGLAPVRSSRQDQIHSSIVSTLLGLMDGLDNRGEIIVIGATNRIDSIDPALRRPGRFDREFPFSLPDKKARREILTIHTRKWVPPLQEHFVDELAERTSGYCGADIMALCAESTLFALRRRYPQIYASNDKFKLNVDSINVTSSDFKKAMKNIIPTSQRSTSNPSRPLSPILRPLFAHTLRNAIIQLAKLFPLIKKRSKILHSTRDETHSDHVIGSSESDSDFEEDEEQRHGRLIFPLNGISLPRPISTCVFRESKINRPRMLICGSKGDGHSSHLAPALLYDLEGFPVHVLDVPVLYGTSTRTPEESCTQIFREALRSAPSIVYMPNATTWWKSTSSTVHETFKSLLHSVSTNTPVLLIATTNCSLTSLPRSLRQIFRPQNTKILSMKRPSHEELMAFFSPIFLQLPFNKPQNKEKRKLENLEILEKVLAPPATELSEKELEKIEYQEESAMTNLRLFLRDVLTRLARDRRFKVFLKPVDTEEVPDYTEVIDKPMDLSTMMSKIDRHLYCNVQSFISDVNLICTNALEYNPDRSAEDRAIRHRACLLRDMTHAIVQGELEPNFEKLCNEVIEARKKRNADPLKFAPSNPPETSSHHRHSKNLTSSPRCGKRTRKDSGSFFGVSIKRRKPSAWASGIIRKYKKKTPLDEGSSLEEEEKQIEDDVVVHDELYEKPDEVKKELRDSSEQENKETKQVASFSSGCEDEEKETKNICSKLEEDSTNHCSEEESNNDGSEQEEKDENNNNYSEEERNGSNLSEEREDNCNDSSGEEERDEDDSEEEKSSSELKKSATDCSEVEQEEESEDSGSGGNEEEASTEIVISTLPEDEEVEEKAGDSHKESSTSSSSGEMEVEDNAVTSTNLNSEKEYSDQNDNNSELPHSANNPSDKDEDVNVESEGKPCSSPVVSPQDLPPSPQLIIDEQKLKNLLHYTVQATSSLRVEDLESLYSCLVRCVFRHRNSYDKSSLIEELNEEVNEFVNFFDDESDEKDNFS